MKILSIDTSSPNCSVCVLEDTTVLKQIDLQDANTHSVNLMPLIQQILEQLHLTLSDIDLFACDKGPGSFTGIRIGIATIKAFCDVTEKPAMGISSLLGLSRKVAEDGIICSLIDAKNDNVYYGLFEKNGENYSQIGELSAQNIYEILPILQAQEKSIFFVGNGSIAFQDVLESNLGKKAIILQGDSYQNITAKEIGLAALQAFSMQQEAPLVPLYLRKSNAERDKEASSHGNCP